MKRCTGCQSEKPLDAFRRGQGYKNGVRSECRDCERERLQRWRVSNRDKYEAQWARANAKTSYNWHNDKEKRAIMSMQHRDKHLRRKYGLSLDQFLDMRDAQGGVCAICKEVPTPTATHPDLVVDHCHETGSVRGLICDRCNRALGCVRDDPVLLQALLVYLVDGLPSDR